MFSGCIPTLVTPFQQQRIDKGRFQELLEWHLSQNCTALCIGGLTGEIYNLTIEEQETLFQHTAQTLKQRIPFIAHIVSSSTREAIWLTQSAEAVGAAAILHSLTTYHANTAQQILHHCHLIQQNTDLPILVQCDLQHLSEPDIVLLANIPQVKGIVDTGHHTLMLSRLLQEVAADFVIYCGNDMNLLSHLINGTPAYFSSIANIFPQEMQQMLIAAHSNNYQQTQAYYQALMPLYQTLYEQGLPSSIKFILSQLHLCLEETRHPLSTLNERASKILLKSYKTAKNQCQLLIES
jgi:4-hydroxy-tetrahydrodipicolinate synthase